MAKNRDGEDVEVPAKDEEEIELEKLVFGDVEGFEANLKKVDNLYDYSSDEQDDGNSDKFFDNSSEEESEEDGELSDDVQDEDLFFIDDGEVRGSKVDQIAQEDDGEEDDDAMDIDDDEEEEEDEEEEVDDDAAWHDSDDERINISLLSSDKLKKLRKSENDVSISGRAYVARLKSQFEKIYPRPEWIDKLEEENDHQDDGITSQDEIDEDSSNKTDNDTNAILNILSNTQQFIITKQLKLISPSKISITRLKDANYQRISKSAIQSVSFHHSHPLLMTGGFDKTIRIYHIDGKINNLVTSLHLHNSPIYSCQFSPLGSNQKDHEKNLVFAAGRRRYMNKWDLNSGEVEKISRMYGHEQYQKSFEYFKISSKGTFIGLTGNSGWCNLLNGSTGQWIKGFKIEGTIVDFEFARDESFIVIINSAGTVWEYELNMSDAKPSSQNSNNNNHNDKPKFLNKIIRKWNDDSGIGITKIKLGGPKNRWLAIGSNNGIVNIYDRNTINDTINPKPVKTIENLVTSISSLVFSPDGQILCIASRAKRDALRLAHVASGTVYSNWPTSGTPLGKVTAVAISPNNEMLAVGNEGGKVTLWRLNHY